MKASCSAALRGLQSFRAFQRTPVLDRGTLLSSRLFVPSSHVYGCRLQSTSTMELVDDFESKSLSSTLQSHTVSRDFAYETADQLQPEFSSLAAQRHWTAFRSAVALKEPAHNNPVLAQEMDLIDAAQMRNAYDKVLILVKHGQVQCAENDDDSEPSNVGQLTGRGIGQTLTTARRVATFLNDDTGLLPELVVVAPGRPTIEAAMRMFPHYSPDSVRSVPWVCHPDTQDGKVDNPDNQQDNGIPESPASAIPDTLVRAKRELLHRSDNFLNWIHCREEQVIVVSSQTTWLQAFGCSMHYDGAPEMFRNGELRAVGVQFI